MKELIIKEMEHIKDLGGKKLAWPSVWEGGLQVLNVESTGECEVGGKILGEKELGNAGGNGHVVAEGPKIFSEIGKDTAGLST